MARTTLPLIVVLIHVVFGGDFVPNVRQNYAAEINDLLISQIQKELSASFIYQAYASYFQRADVSLSGISKFFAEASLEERTHAQSLIDYINKRGGYTQFDSIDPKGSCEAVLAYLATDTSGLDKFGDRRLCICGYVATKNFNEDCGERGTWKEGLMAFEDALAIERYVNEQLLNIHKKADDQDDAHLAHILEHEFLEEQVSSISKLAHFVTRLRSFEKGNNYKLGEYIFDQHLA
jgi:ferritin heavy chain